MELPTQIKFVYFTARIDEFELYFASSQCFLCSFNGWRFYSPWNKICVTNFQSGTEPYSVEIKGFFKSSALRTRNHAYFFHYLPLFVCAVGFCALMIRADFPSTNFNIMALRSRNLWFFLPIKLTASHALYFLSQSYVIIEKSLNNS